MKYINPKIHLLASVATFFIGLVFATTINAQSKLPSDAFSTITDAGNIILTNPRKALAMVAPLREAFNTESGFDNLEDAQIYQSVLFLENTVYDINKQYSKLFLNLRLLQEGTQPRFEKNDAYITMFFTAKLNFLMYRARQEGNEIYKNPRYASALRGLVSEVEAVSFKNQVMKQQLIASIKGFI